jgi:hypothetical protein
VQAEDNDSGPEQVGIVSVVDTVRRPEVEIASDEDIVARSGRKEVSNNATEREPSAGRKLGRDTVLEIARFGR